MGDILYGIDFRNKKRMQPVETPLETGLSIIALALEGTPIMSIDDIPWPGMDILFVAPEKDPA